ncbi:hypothetical protein [Pseudomonas azerbaijanoccidentalis]
MNDLEAEMRQALFGTAASTPTSDKTALPIPVATPTKPRPVVKALSPKLRVTMHVTKEFEGELEIFVYDVSTLSTLTAEIEAKAAAKKKKFKYVDVVSIQSVD